MEVWGLLSFRVPILLSIFPKYPPLGEGCVLRLSLKPPSSPCLTFIVQGAVLRQPASNCWCIRWSHYGQKSVFSSFWWWLGQLVDWRCDLGKVNRTFKQQVFPSFLWLCIWVPNTFPWWFNLDSQTPPLSFFECEVLLISEAQGKCIDYVKDPSENLREQEAVSVG